MAEMLTVKIELAGTLVELEVEKDSKTHRQLVRQIEDAQELEFAAFRSSANIKIYAAIGAVFEELTDEEKLALVGQTSFFRWSATRVLQKDTVPANQLKVMKQGTRGGKLDESMVDEPIS